MLSTSVVSTPPRLPARTDLGGHIGHVTVLVADDFDVVQRLCRHVLEKAGYKVLTASNGSEAVSLALANSPDLILLDHAMPGIDSMDAMRHIRDQRPDIAVVVMSVLSTPRDRERYLANGADEVLTKPFRLVDLLRLVARFTTDRGEQMNRRRATIADVPTGPYPSMDIGAASVLPPVRTRGGQSHRESVTLSDEQLLLDLALAEDRRPSQAVEISHRAPAEDLQPSQTVEMRHRAPAEDLQPSQTVEMRHRASAEDLQPSQAVVVRRAGSAHEERVANGRRWCAICGWLDEIKSRNGDYLQYHSDFTKPK